MSGPSNPSAMHPDLEDRIARAEAAVAVIKPKFKVALTQDLARLCDLANAGLDGETLAEQRALIHDIKGNAGGFGFNLVSDIAACLNAYLDAITALGPLDAKIIRDHCASMTIAAAAPLDVTAREQIEEFIRLSQRLTADARGQSEPG